MLTRVGAGLGFVLAWGCAAAEKQTEPPSAGEGQCVEAMLLVTQVNAGPGDPVQTQVGLMRSKAFSAGAPAASDPTGILAIERVGESALIRLHVEAEPQRALSTCSWVVERALQFELGDGQSEWLQSQTAALRKRLRAAEESLAAFDREHPQLEIQSMARRRLVRDIEGQQALLGMLLERQMQIQLQGMQKHLRVIDACAPCGAPKGAAAAR